LPVRETNGRAEIAIGPQSRTIWYEVEIRGGR
jgi:hypothetical protein